MSIADLLRVGDTVWVDCIEGFGGAAHVVEVRNNPSTRCKVQINNANPQPPFWAHNFELSPRPVAAGEPYDSRADTLLHIQEVRRRIATVVKRLEERSERHDLSKLEEPEKSAFDTYTPKLRDTTYGSEEYKEYLRLLGEALNHHYAHNSHHPEHYPNGIQGMDLLDVVEMLCDWKAATLRHADGDLRKSIEINQQRFGYTDELRQILANTARRLGFFESVKKAPDQR